MAASAQDNSSMQLLRKRTRTRKAKRGGTSLGITGLHLDGGFGSGQFMCAAPTKQTKGWDTREMEGTQGSHRRHMRQTFGMDGGEGKHIA
jgi:hypothetical protein